MSWRLDSGFAKASSIRNVALVFAVGLLFGTLFSGAVSSKADTFSVMPHLSKTTGTPTCTGPLTPTMTPTDLDVTGTCTVGAGTYYFNTVDIYGKGSLVFADTVTDFWAKSIIIENGASLTAGVAPDGTMVPVGTAGGKLTIHLWGPQQGPPNSPEFKAVGVPCHDKTCGIPMDLFMSNNMKTLDPKECKPASDFKGTLPNDDCFYMYDSMPYDGGGNVPAYYGYKVLGLGYGGTLRLYGLKGATYPDTTVTPSNTGTSWVRLNNCAAGNSDPNCTTDGVLKAGATTLTLDSAGPLGWKQGDDIIVTTTDYLTSHTEHFQLTKDAVGNTVTIADPGLLYPHHAAVVNLSSRLPAKRGLTDLTSVDTRAAVALLSRNIRIVSGGDTAGTDLPAPAVPPVPNPATYFGGHVVFRQGFKQLQIQGVEFNQLGEGGRIGHYPVHFHMARQVPTDTYVKDSSVWDSMTRFIVLHATQGVLLARNVGYRSIGMGYYLEDGTETGNKLYANLGVSSIAAVNDFANNRLVPGILANNKFGDGTPYLPNSENTPYDSDFEHPSVFWFMNGWNDFEYNMAVGAEMCGNCYWMPPGANSGGSRNMFWTGYASEQKSFNNQGTSPLMEFLGNSCSTAMMAFHINGNTAYCSGINTNFAGNPSVGTQFTSVPNSLLPLPVGVKTDKKAPDIVNETFYPRVNAGGNHHTTKCPSLTGDCSTQPDCSNSNLGNCMVLVLDRFTTSFNYAAKNFAAIWLRPQFNLVLNSAITDVLNGGLTFVTGGGYTRADALLGIWDLARKSVFIGNTQSFGSNPYASNGGPVNPSGLACGNKQPATNYCVPIDAAGNDTGVAFNRDSFSTNQRFFSIYDGPSLEDSNAFLDITATQLADCDTTSPGVDFRCFNSKWMEGTQLGLPGVVNPTSGQPPTACYLPNAAIAWKQPNGFYYPPSFHSTNLYFNNVDIHHYVIEPKFLAGTYKTDDTATKSLYCNRQSNMFTPDFTDIDRQTELNDDDGTLTGLVETVSVNQDPFFQAPTQDVECKSDVVANKEGTAITSPYDYVTTVVYPDCATVPWDGPVKPPLKGACNDTNTGNVPVPWTWSYPCTSAACYGVPLYRQYLNPGETTAPFIRLSSQATGQRETMAPNNGLFYIDTTVDKGTQTTQGSEISVFQADKKYHVFLLFAKPGPPSTTTTATKETYQIFVGKGLDTTTLLNSVTAEKATVSSAAASFTTFAWPTGWIKTYQPTDTGMPATGGGILTVTVDLSAAGGSGFATDYNNSIYNPSNPTETRCQPSTMCAWNTTNSDCECNISSNPSDPLGLFYLYNDCQGKTDTSGPSTGPASFCKWAISDVDYPDAGAYGFSFTLGSTFATVPTQAGRDALRPAPSCFPKTQMIPNPMPPPPTLLVNSPWNIPFVAASAALAQGCFYTNTPPSPKFCTTPGDEAADEP